MRQHLSDPSIQESNPERSTKAETGLGRIKRVILELLRGEDGTSDRLQGERTRDTSVPQNSDITGASEAVFDGSKFNEHWLKVIQSQALTEGRRSGASIGVGLGTISLIPFGPIAMCVCGLAGLLFGYMVGFVYDINRNRTRNSLAEKELRRLTYLVRFASEQIDRRLFIHSSQADTEYCLDILESVILEFKPFVEVAHLSPIIHRKLNLFHTFLRHSNDCVWLYVNGFLSRWTTSLTVPEFVRITQDILSTLVLVEKKLGLTDPHTRLEVIIKVEEFLNDPKVKVFNSLHTRQSDAVKSTLEAVLIRDHHRVPSDATLLPSGSPARRRLSSLDAYSARSIRMIPSGSPLSPLDLEDSVDSDDLVFEDPIDDLSSPRRTNATPRLSRAFFKSFQDFMDFDLDLKHKMPILAQESHFLYEKELEPLNAPGWELAVDKRLIKVLKYIPQESSKSQTAEKGTSVLVRAYAIIPNTRIETCFFNIFDPNQRRSWDSNFADISLIPNKDCEILYSVLQSPFGVTPRDFLQYRKAVSDSRDSLTIMMRSAIHPDKPNLPGFIRAETFISGYVMRQKGNDCHLFIMSQTDVKGLIPKWIVNMMAAKAPAQWVENLVKSCGKTAARFKGNEGAMQAELERYVCAQVSVPPSSI
jgi:hypothetical protein